MKNTIILAPILVLLLSCSYSERNNQLGLSDLSNTLTSGQRNVLIASLNKLGTAFSEKDEQAIAHYFRFPLADSAIDLYVDDPAFDTEREYSGGRVSKQMFARYFKKIWNDMQMEQMSYLFRHIDLSLLSKTDKLSFRDIKPDQHCYSFYEVSLVNDEILLTFGTNTNELYQPNAKKKEELEDECAFASYWYLKFDGREVYFERQKAE